MMRLGHVDLVVVGADRIAANGDVANKVGTYGVAVLAKEHGIPFYVAAPISTVDLNTPDGAHIPIEERNEREVTHVGASRLTPGGRADPEPGVRRDAGEVRHRHRHRARNRVARRTTNRSQLPALSSVTYANRAARSRKREPTMIVLGIETSCDETAAAVVEETGDPQRPWRVRSNVVASQIDIHREWGGVVPELSARQHIRDICGVVERALGEAGVDTFDAIAVTQGPGLVGSLLVGLSFAKALAWARSVPLIPVHHLAGHIESLVLEGGEMPLPAVVLVVSGGHTSLYRIERPGAYELLGRTRDDAAGEAFDKVAKLLGLGYPGGPVIDRVSPHGNDRAVALPKTRMTHADRNAPHLPGPPRLQLQRPQDVGAAARERPPRRARARRGCAAARAARRGHRRQLSARRRRDAARSAVRRGALVRRAERRDRRRCLGEQPAARGRARRAARRAASPCSFPSLALSTDNAAMIAAAGLRRHRAGAAGALDVNADASLALT